VLGQVLALDRFSPILRKWPATVLAAALVRAQGAGGHPCQAAASARGRAQDRLWRDQIRLGLTLADEWAMIEPK